MAGCKEQWTVLVLAAALAAMSGCQRTTATTGHNPQVAQNNIEEDEAMQLRAWDRSTAEYINGDVIAGPTWQTFEPSDELGGAGYTAMEVPIFLTNVVLMPVAMFRHPPGSEVVYQGEQFEPTHTGMPVATLSGEIIHEEVERAPALEPAEPVSPQEPAAPQERAAPSEPLAPEEPMQ